MLNERHAPLAIPTAASLLLSVVVSACGLTSPLYVESKFSAPTPLSTPPVVVVAPPVDARRFTAASNRAPVPSVRGNPLDSDLTTRTIGRRLSGTGMLGANVTLPPGESVAHWVGRAVVDGLRRANVPAVAADSEAVDVPMEVPHLEVTVLAFWLDVKPEAAIAIIEYRAEVEISGDWPRLAGGRTVSTQGTVSAGGLDNTLWRRSFDKALDDIVAKTARAVDPAGALR